MSDGPRSSPPPPPPDPVARTGSYPAARAETTAERALRVALQARADIGHPPIAATKDPGSGLWAAVDEVRTVVVGVNSTTDAILARLNASEAAAASRGGLASKIAWEFGRLLIAAVFVAFVAWLSGHWHW